VGWYVVLSSSYLSQIVAHGFTSHAFTRIRLVGGRVAPPPYTIELDLCSELRGADTGSNALSLWFDRPALPHAIAWL
jgi:hypothetical protein